MRGIEESEDEFSNHNSAPGGARPALPAPGAPTHAGAERPLLVPIPFKARQEHAYFAGQDIPRDESPTEAPRRDWRRLRAAAGLAAVVAIGAAAAAEHMHALRIASTEQARTHTLASRLDAMSAKLESLEAGRSRDEVANLHKVVAEIKTSAANTRDVGGAVGQLASRVERLEKEQGVRLDKLGDRIDRDSAARLADVSARLDKLEAKGAPKTAAAKANPGVSYEPTGGIERPAPRLRQYYLAAVRNGYAMIDSPLGAFAVAPGDVVPGGGGRVLRIERHGRAWAVVTTRGEIVAMND